MGEEKDGVLVRIEDMVNELPRSTPSKPIIDRVDHCIRQVNGRDYEPELVSIGPIHRGEDRVKSMEQHKVRYLRKLVDRVGRLSIEKLVLEVRNLVEKARLCYPTSVSLDEDEFVEMMLLDGCFVVELIRDYFFDDMREKDDQIFKSNQTLNQIRHDLMLLENQLPFFVFSHLFDMTKMEDPDDDLAQLLLFFVGDMLPWPDDSRLYPRSDILNNADHLLGLVYTSSFSFSAKYLIENTPHKQNTFMHISSASELKEAGIRIKGRKEITLWSISFANGVMKLPLLTISDKTESILRNLIAYEQCFSDDHPKYVTDYAFLMHCLIRSTKDVEVLQGNGIISNFLGSDDMICLMINRLGKNVAITSDFCYSDVIGSVERHCRLQRRRLMPKLRKYFNTPWVIVSFLGGAILLLLTLIQTVFCVLSYRRSSLPNY